MLMDRGFGARNRRVRSLDVESYQDFMLGFRGFTYGALDKSAERGVAVNADVAGFLRAKAVNRGQGATRGDLENRAPVVRPA